MKTLKNIKGRVWTWVNGPQANENEISFFDVKELYDAAFAAQTGSAKEAAALMAQAEALDAAYRAQLAARRPGPAAALYGKAA